MLSARQVQALRREVEAAERMAPAEKLATFIDGPLRGLRTSVLPARVRADGSLGWCLPTDRGVVITYYEPSAGHRAWRFRDFGYPGRRESGLTVQPGKAPDDAQL